MLMKIGQKLALGFGVILLLVVALSIAVVGKLSGMNVDSAHIVADLASKTKVSAINTAVKDNAISSMEMLLNSDAGINAKIAKQIAERNQSNNTLIDELARDLAGSPDDLKLLTEMKKHRGLYVGGLDRVLGMITAGKREEATYVAGEEMIPMLAPFLKAVKALDDQQSIKVDTSTKQIQATASSIRNMAIMLGIAVVVLGMFSAISIIRAIAGPLNQMRTTIMAVDNDGDFTRRIGLSSKDEVGETARAFDNLVQSLQQTLGTVLQSAEKVARSAHSLSASSSNLANSSSSQSASTSAMAAAAEKMTASTNKVSESAREALDISRQSGDLSVEGGEIIDKAANEMSRIAETVRNTSSTIEEVGQQSNQISSIVQVIKEIASQTNLLALNAAIEAARAGEQGRGFAVVADEVRKLAERTTKATEEISSMIGAVQRSADAAVLAMGASVSEVSSGVMLANQAGNTIVKIKDGAGRVVGVVNNISSVLSQQCSANDDLARQVEIVAQMTAENSAAASETAQEAAKLQELASDMREAVGRFKI
jgi:methyl-accepting chemotaxis protein